MTRTRGFRGIGLLNTAMPKRRHIRRLAMQVLYQLDVRGDGDQEDIREGLVEGPDDAEVAQAAFELAQSAWACHAQADALIKEIAPHWPTHRQPPVDRALLRLAYHEMVSGYSPVKVAINEAIELAKEYCSEQSPSFINGVLDKLAKRITPGTPLSPADAWLADAMDEPGEKPKTPPDVDSE